MGKRCYHRGITVWSLTLPGAPWGTEVWGHCQFTSLLRAKRRGPCSDQLQLKCKASFAFPLSPKSRYVTWERDEQLWQGKGGLLFSRSHGRSLEGTEPPGPQVKSRRTWSLRRSSHSPWGASPATRTVMSARDKCPRRRGALCARGTCNSYAHLFLTTAPGKSRWWRLRIFIAKSHLLQI